MEQSWSPDNPFIKKQEKKPTLSPDNPFINKVGEVPETHTEDPNKDPGFFDTLGNTAQYLVKALPTVGKNLFMPGASIQNAYENLPAIKQVGSDVLKTVESMSPTTPGQFQTASIISNTIDKASEIFQSAKQNFQGLPLMVAKGGLKMLEVPVDVLNQTHDENGVAIPNTPQQQADAIKSAIGMVVQGAATSKMMSFMNPELGAEAKITFSQKPKIGRLVTSIPKSVIANAVGGASQGMVSHLGKEDQLASAIGEGLAFAPVGILFGPLGEFKIDIKDAVKQLRDKSAGELASLRALQITGEDSPINIQDKIDQFASSDDYTIAAVKNNLNDGKGFILNADLHDVQKVKEALSPSTKNSEGIFDPDANNKVSKKIRLGRINVGGSFPRWLDFKDPFDKAVFLSGNSAAKGGLSESQNLVREEIKSQLGLTDAEIDSHRDAIKNYYKTEGEKNLKQLSQPEIDKMNNEIVAKGNTKLLSTLDNTSFKDNTGKTWTKTGSMITDGQQVLDINSNLAKQIAGRSKGQVEPTAPLIEIPKQNFQPNYGRDVKNFQVYEGFGGVNYISPEPLNIETQEFFKKTGFLPNEIVVINGLDHIVKGESKAGNYQVQNLSTGKTSYRSPFDIKRSDNGLTSEIYKAANGEQVAKYGILNRDTFYRSLFNKFQSDYDLSATEGDSYTKSILKFANKIGMTNQDDISLLGKEFQSQLIDKIDNSLDGDEIESGIDYLVNLKKGVESFDKYLEDKKFAKLSHAFDTNNMYLKSDGGGSYSIRDLGSTKELAKVKSYQEALDWVTNSRQANGLDLDGGDSNIVPPGAAGGNGGTGRNSTPFQISKDSHSILDIWNTGRFGKYAAPIQALFKSVDNILLEKGKDTEFFKYSRAMQTAQGVFKNNAMSTFKPVSESFNKVIESLKKVPEDRHHIISDYVETQSIPEIESEIGPDEMKAGKSLANNDVDSIIAYLREVRSTDAKVGSPEFVLKSQEAAAKLSQANTPIYDPKVVKIANQLIQSQDPALLYRVLKYAKALNNPLQALTRDEFSSANKMTKDELLVAKNFDETLNKGHDIFNLNKSTKAYLPNVELAEAAGHNPWGDTPFGKEFAKLAIDTETGSLERDPNLLLRKFVLAGSRTLPMIQTSVAFPGEVGPLLSFNDVLKRAVKYQEEVYKSDPSLRPYANQFNEHIADVRGIPDNSELAGKAADQFFEERYGKKRWDKSKAAILISHSALLGGRLALTLRDVKNGWENVANQYGYDYAFKMLSNSINKEYAQELRAKGILPSESGLDLLMPGEDIHTGMARISKIADGTMKWNGNLLAHQQMLAGLYKTTIQEVGKLSGDLINEDTAIRDKALKKLKLQVEDPIIQKQFTDMIARGKTQEAADILGRERSKTMLNWFGQHNNPTGWENSWGRLAGGMMSWGVNQAQTMARGLLRGSKTDRLGFAAKMMGHNAATLGIGGYAGVNLASWTLSPFSLVGQSPILNAGYNSIKTVSNLTNQNPNVRGDAEKSIMNIIPHNDHTVAQLYIPYSFKLQEFIDGAEMADKDYGVPSGLRAAGIGTSLPFKSPLQKEMGNHPRDIKTNKIVKENTLTSPEKVIKKKLF